MDPINHTSPRRLLCPRERCAKEKTKEKVIKIRGEIKKYQIVKSSYYITDDAADDEKPGYPSSHLLSLVTRHRIPGRLCKACMDWCGFDKTLYLCRYCDDYYHKECVESLSIIHNPFHPKHPLQLVMFSRILRERCYYCGDKIEGLLYYCSACNFMIHPVCATSRTIILEKTIFNQKRHHHTLHFFPRKSDLVCDVCGFAETSHVYKWSLYVCYLCDFIVHKRCVVLPYVIKVSRHNHRLAFTPNLPYDEEEEGSIDCGVCHTKIDANYGEYSCTKKGCIYALHSGCAMRPDVWDGKELEGEPEDPNENTKMFEEVSNGIIQHHSHPGHHMRLLEKTIQSVYVYEEIKHCQACRLPEVDGNIYRCMQCDDFILHQSCAYLPRRLPSILLAHPLILELGYTTRGFQCEKCRRYSCGFAYVSSSNEVHLSLDTICASISEPFYYHSHPHPLFLTYGQTSYKKCSICQEMNTQPLNCVKCNFDLCFHCATLPHKVRYEHDDHMLFFKFVQDKNDGDEFYWCEICEEDIDPKFGLYECNECRVTLHIKCLLGRDPYLKPGVSVTTNFGRIFHVLPNNYSTRPICKSCGRHCPYKIKIETTDGSKTFCSAHCFFLDSTFRPRSIIKKHLYRVKFGAHI